jgi:hypothetical protein
MAIAYCLLLSEVRCQKEHEYTHNPASKALTGIAHLGISL